MLIWKWNLVSPWQESIWWLCIDRYTNLSLKRSQLIIKIITFSTEVDSGGRSCAITRIRISLELTKHKAEVIFLFLNIYLYMKHKKFGNKMNMQCRRTYVRIPSGFPSTATTAEPERHSSICFVAMTTVSVGERVMTLELLKLVWSTKIIWAICILKEVI